MKVHWGSFGSKNRTFRVALTMRKSFVLILPILFIITSFSAGRAMGEKDYIRVETYNKLKIGIPNETWYGEYLNGLKTVELYKEGYHHIGDPTVRVFIDELPIEDSILATKAFDTNAFASKDECEDITLQAGEFALRGFRETYEYKGTNTIE